MREWMVSVDTDPIEATEEQLERLRDELAPIAHGAAVALHSDGALGATFTISGEENADDAAARGRHTFEAALRLARIDANGTTVEVGVYDDEHAHA